MKAILPLVTTLIGLGVGLALLEGPQNYSLLVSAVTCIVGAGIGLLFGRLIAGPPPQT